MRADSGNPLLPLPEGAGTRGDQGTRKPRQPARIALLLDSEFTGLKTSAVCCHPCPRVPSSAAKETGGFLMQDVNLVDPGYPEPAKLEMIWGEGFLSPGGPAEVARILGGHDVAGRNVLDVGSGTGGADIALVRDHGAASVVGIDVEGQLIEAAARRAVKAGLGSRIRYQLVAPGLLLFADASFDVVFSKDAIIHVHDKKRLYAELLRVLRPGGRLMVSDWLRGKGRHLDGLVQDFITASGHSFALMSLDDIGELASATGFAGIELEDRQEWYMRESEAELRKLHGPLGQQFRHRWGDKVADDEIAFWEVLVAAVKAGAVRPGHIRAAKP